MALNSRMNYRSRAGIMAVAAVVLLAGGLTWAGLHRGHLDPNQLPEECGSCHVGHGPSGSRMLPQPGEEFCYLCHGSQVNLGELRRTRKLGPGARPRNLEGEMQKPSHHPVERYLGNRTNLEALLTDPGAPRQVECLDCHDQHVSPTESAVEQLDPQRSFKASSTRAFGKEYQLCYACHGKALNFPFDATDIQLKTSPDNPSYHPIEAAGKSRLAPSLRSPYLPTSFVQCTDCHNNDDPGGPRGPHGSIYAPLLVRNYIQTDRGLESEAAYDLCYQCHRRSSILADESFREHRRHVAEEKISCHTCHDPHGSTQYPSLIRFNPIQVPTEVSPDCKGRMEYDSAAGRCYLSCHKFDHDPVSCPSPLLGPQPSPSLPGSSRQPWLEPQPFPGPGPAPFPESPPRRKRP